MKCLWISSNKSIFKFGTKKCSAAHVIVGVVSRVRAEAVVEVAEDLLGQERVLRLERVCGRVEEHRHEVGLDDAAPEGQRRNLY